MDRIRVRIGPRPVRVARGAARDAVRCLRQHDPGVLARGLGLVVAGLPDHLVARLRREILKRNRIPQQPWHRARGLPDPSAHERDIPLLRGEERRFFAVALAAVALRPWPEDRRHVRQLSRGETGHIGLRARAIRAERPCRRRGTVVRVRQKRAVERIADRLIQALAPKQRGTRRADNVVGQCADIPGNAQSHQVPRAVLVAQNRVRLAVDQQIDAPPRASDPACRIGQQRRNVRARQRRGPPRRLVKPALRAAARCRVMQKRRQPAGAGRVGRPRRDLGSIQPDVDPGTGGIGQHQRMGVPPRQRHPGNDRLARAGKQDQPPAPGRAVHLHHRHTAERQQRHRRRQSALPPVRPRPHQEPSPGQCGAEGLDRQPKSLVGVHDRQELAA